MSGGGEAAAAGASRPAGRAAGLRAVPAGIWALGFVSLLMDVSSEMIHALLPVYLVAGLGVSVLAVGVIEGVAGATAAFAKVFSGALSDWLGRRKLLAVIGYGLAAVTKPVFPLAASLAHPLEWLIAARFVDRIGKGVRGAPRDALVAEIAPPELRGASFGLRKSLDMAGAFLGPLLAIGLMALTADDFSLVFWVAVIPAFASVGVLLAFVKEPRRAPAKAARLPLRRSELRRLGGGYWLVVALAGLFTLARFSEAFLILRAQSLGAPMMLTPGVLVLMALAFALSAYPVGALSDRVGRGGLLVCGLVLLILADLTLAFSDGFAALALGVALWGLHMGFTQGVLTAMIADSAPADLRGTAFGMFHLVCGAALLAASIIAGLLWDAAGPQATFLAGAGFTLLALLAFLPVRAALARRA